MCRGVSTIEFTEKKYSFSSQLDFYQAYNLKTTKNNLDGLIKEEEEEEKLKCFINSFSLNLSL